MDKQQALHSFWSQFCKAYNENSVEDNPKFPYITYESAVDSFGYPVSLTASIWDRSTSWETVIRIANNISETVGMGGTTIPYDNGALWITKGSPWAQQMGDSNDTIRQIVINIEAEYLSAD